ncbi:MAG: NrfD/PsrC family molybdoenzyme membrane anchor subunit [Candidatus Hydrothermarchaeota archaeon]
MIESVQGFVFPNEIEVQWSILIALYPYITGLVAGAFIVSSIYHVFGRKEVKPVAKLAVLTAYAFLLICVQPLLFHLTQPLRAPEIFLTPNPNSAMAAFGYVYLSYLIILTLEIWFIFREDIVRFAKSSRGIKKLFYFVLALGITDISKEALETDHKITTVLAAIGIPSACLLHGYAGFIFGSIKANPWWSTPLMPIIFLLSAIVSGIAMLILIYVIVSKIRRTTIDRTCMKSLATYLWYFLVIDLTFESLEVLSKMYESAEEWGIISQLISKKIAFTFIGVQMIMGEVIPIIVIGSLLLFKFGERVRNAGFFLSSLLVVIGVFAMRWNVVIGGQLFSKSLRGFTTYAPEFLSREGILPAIFLMTLPFVILAVSLIILPPWEREEREKKELKEIFGDRVSFDENELILYSHDVGTLPDVVPLFMLDTLPDAVVLPENKEELVKLVNLANEFRIPLIPRGSATGGYGGALPVYGGIVVNFSKMDRIIEINKEEKTATIEPGVIWDRLEKELNKQGLQLKHYPSSAPSATVAGWIAQGGTGIGSLTYGNASTIVKEAELVTPDGKVETFKGKNLDLVCECEGITGFITKLKIEVKDYEEIIPVTVLFKDASSLESAINQVVSYAKPYTIAFGTPGYIKLKQEATGHRLLPEDKYYAIFAYYESQYEKVKEKFAEIIHSNSGEIASAEVSKKEWEERFYPLRIKRLGPSVIPSEALIPNARLKDVLEEVEKETKGMYIGAEGQLASEKESALLVFFLEDERSFLRFTFGWNNAFKIVDIARKFGGRVYSTGIWFSGESESYFGKERLEKIRKFKKERDPNDIMNPGKIFPPEIKAFPLMPISKGIELSKPFMSIGSKIFRYQRAEVSYTDQ